MLTFGKSSGAPELPQDPTSTLTAPFVFMYWEPVLDYIFFFDYFWLFSERIAPLPVFPKLNVLSLHSPRHVPIFPGMTIFHRVYSLFPGVSSQVLIMDLENVVAVMIALSKSGKWGSLSGIYKQDNSAFPLGEPQMGKVPARTCFSEKVGSRQTELYANGAHVTLWELVGRGRHRKA